MQLTQEDGRITVETAVYHLATHTDRPFVTLRDGAGEPLAQLFALAGVQPLHGRDDAIGSGDWQAARTEAGITLSLAVHSSAWAEKIVRFVCREDDLQFEVEISGAGQIVEYQPFGGYYSGNVRWGSGFFFSGQSFRRGFNPEPNSDEITFFSPAEGTAIDLTGVPLPGRGDWFFTPPPFCFAFEGAAGWLGLGVAARPGHNNFTTYRYAGQRGTFHLALEYEGHTAVDGRYHLPAITFHFAADPYAALAAHAAGLRAAGLAPAVVDPPQPAWWHEPIFCGWGPQCHLAAVAGGRAADFARQEHYDIFLATLAANGLEPGIVVLDDKWQATYGDNEVDPQKWPDLRGFVDAQHAAGRKVLLWLKAWDPEGLPAAECVRNAAGLPIAFDPTHPAFEARLRAAVRRMLGPEGYDADGFKLDFTARIPSGPGLQKHGRAWGLELLRAYLAILHGAAKATKPDALIMTHTPHPYLADLLDMIRLNDINTGKDVNAAMRHRARVAAIACPTAIIDTDNWPITDRAAWRAYVPLQGELGVPSLYYVDHIDSTGEPLEEADYQLIRESWAAHRAKRGRG